MVLSNLGIRNRFLESLLSLALIAAILLLLFFALNPLVGREFDLTVYLLTVIIVGAFTVFNIFSRPKEQSQARASKKAGEKPAKKPTKRTTKKTKKSTKKTKKSTKKSAKKSAKASK